MTKQFGARLLIILPVSMAITGLAWNLPVHQRVAGAEHSYTDTLPSKNKTYRGEKKGDIDQQIEQLEKAMQQLDQTLEKQDWEKMQRDLQESLAKIDTEKMQAELERALGKIDAEKIRMDVERAMKKADLKKIERELQLELEKNNINTNRQDLNRELEKALHEARKGLEEVQKINYDQIKEEIAAARKNIALEKLRIADEIANARKELDMGNMNIREQLHKAKSEIIKTKTQMENYRKMIQEMDNDRLLKSKQNYSIQYKDGSLFINGKQQPKQVVDKYKHYFPMDGVTLKRELDGQFEINNK